MHLILDKIPLTLKFSGNQKFGRLFVYDEGGGFMCFPIETDLKMYVFS
jgi:hypothetical protein